MSGINIITANFTNNKRATVTRKLYKGDYGQKIQVKGLDLPEFFQVHFSHDLKSGGTAKKILSQNNEITIPDEYLTSGKTIYAWIFLHQGTDSGQTRHTITIPVIDKPDVIPAQPTPVQQDIIGQTIALLTETLEDSQAWAAGTRNGVPVTSDDETYQNNSKYYSQQAELFKEQSESNVRHYPKIIDGYWYLWDIANNQYINTWQRAQGDRDSLTQTVSGNIVYIPDGGQDLPIQKLIVNITPQQYGNGTPIYYNIRPFKSGLTQITLETRGKNLFDQSRFPLADFPKIINPDNTYYGDYYGSLRNLGYNTTSIFHINNGGFIGKVPVNDILNISFDIKYVLPRTYVVFYYTDGTDSSYSHFIGQNGYYGHYSVHSDINKKVSGVNITTIANDSSYSGIKNLQIERGTNETEYTNYAKSYTVNWAATAQPIYGGYIDLISGTLVKTYQFISEYNGETLPGHWYSDRDVYYENTLPTIGAQVVYELEEPVTYNLQPLHITTLKGDNNIWANNSNNLQIEYCVDQSLYINTKLQQAKQSGEFKGDPGYTPQKGIDYFTQEDINIVATEAKQQTIEYLGDIAIYKYQGSVNNYEDLPQTPNKGDVYNVINKYAENPPGTNWAWTGEEWDSLGGSFNVETATDQDIANMIRRLKLEYLGIEPIAGEGIAGEAILSNTMNIVGGAIVDIAQID